MPEFRKYMMWGPYHWNAWSQPEDNGYKKHARFVRDWVTDKNVLDIGCGDGLITYLIGAKGIDSCEAGIGCAQKRKLDCHLGTIHELERWGRFDAALVADTFAWIENQDNAVEELGKITKKVYVSSHLEDPEGMPVWGERELDDLFERHGWKATDKQFALGRIYVIYECL